MSPFLRMKRLFPWRPQCKRNLVEARHQLSQPQLSGSPGWILLTHNTDNVATALFVDSNEKVETFQIILDERMFSDTVLRVVKLSPRLFVLCDIRWFNGVNVFEKMNFEKRKETIRELLDLFHFPDLVGFVLPEDVPIDSVIRGHEYYDDQPGTLGVFLPADE
jgi:hypothetical protein